MNVRLSLAARLGRAIGRLATATPTGQANVRATLSAALVHLGEPAAAAGESLDALRIRYKDALLARAAPTDPEERARWEAT